MYLEAPETTEKALSLKKTGLAVLASKLPAPLNEWKVIGFTVEPAETITKYPLIIQLTLAHDEYSDLGEQEQLIEDFHLITDWLKSLGVDLGEVEYDINADRYELGDEVPAEEYTPQFEFVGDEL